MITETLEKLKSLQDILAQKYLIESELKELPRSLTTKSELVNRLKKSFIEKHERLTAAKSYINDLRIKMRDAETERENYEGKIAEISTQREYEALVKEIRDAGEREQNYRKELQREEKAFEELEKAIEREELLIKDQEKELTLEQEKIHQETQDRESLLTELDNQEQAITPDIDGEIVFKFKRIIRSKEGKGIVPLQKGVCTGCNMILPLQFVNDVRSGEQIHFCPYCSMILFYQEAGSEDALENLDLEDTADLFDESEFDDDFADDMDDFDDSIGDDEEDLDDLDEEEEDDDDDDEDDDQDDSSDEEEVLDDDLDDDLDDGEDDLLDEEIEE